MIIETTDKGAYFVKEGKRYAIPADQVQRLIARPSTRVLKLIDEDGEPATVIIDVLINEVEGYALLAENFS